MSRWRTNLWALAVLPTAFAACLMTLWGCGNATGNLPPYNCALRFARTAPETHTPGEPIPVSCQLYRLHPDAPLPDMPYVPGDSPGPRHWLRLAVTDPDGLAYLWERRLTHEQAHREQERFRNAPNSNLSFSFDLRDWVPPDFRWKSGEYRFFARVTVAWQPVESLVGVMFMNEVPADAFRHKYPALLSAELEANGTDFAPGDTIVLRGYVKNESHQPLMVHTRNPFRYASLVAEGGRDRFPSPRPSGPLRLSHFTRIEPGQRVLLFEEPFVAGRSDPHWSVGMRREWFPPPFATGFPRTIYFELRSSGEFPEDCQPSLGIWAGVVTSNRVTITVKQPVDKPPD
jgi:hypothetical protein